MPGEYSTIMQLWKIGMMSVIICFWTLPGISQPLKGSTRQVPYICYPRFTDDDTAAIQQLVRAGTELQWSRPVAAMTYLVRARDLSLLTGFYDGAAQAYLHMAHTALGQGNYEQSFSYYEQARPWCEQALLDKSLTAVLYSDIATTYLHKGTYPEATLYYFKALKELAEKGLSESPRNLVIYANLATIQTSLSQYDQAQYYLSLAEKLARKKSYNDQLAFILNNLGDVYVQLNKLEPARQCYLEGLKLLPKNEPDISRNLEVKQSIYNSLAALMLKQLQPRQAIDYLKKSSLLSNATNPYFSSIFPAYLLGEAWYQLRNYPKALAVLEPALDKAAALGFRESMYEARANLAAVYEGMGQYKDALEQQKVSMLLKDSLMNVEKTRAVSQLEIRYRTAQKDKELIAKQLLISRQHSELDRKNTLIWVVSLGSLLITSVLILLVVLYRNIKHQQRLQSEKLISMERDKELAIQEKELVKKEEDLKIMEALIKGEENERSRLARELHDGIGGMLAAVQMHFSVMQHRKDESTRRVPELMGMLEDIASEVRKTSHNMMPDILLKHSLEEALQLYCDKLNEGGGITLELQMHDNPGIPPGTASLSIYRIIQELIQNIIKHAEAKHGIIQIVQQEDKLRIMIEDDGKGFDTSSYKEGLGLRNLRNRVHHLQGYVSVESVKGSGTTVFIEFEISNLKNLLAYEYKNSHS